MSIEVKRMVFNENGAITEIEFYPGTDLADAMDQITKMNLTSQGYTPRIDGIARFLENRANKPKPIEYPPSPKQDA